MSIPEVYFSEFNEQPFRICTRCEGVLHDKRQGYQIVKYWHHNEVVYEYALCHPCHQQMISEFSEESRSRLHEYHEQRLHAGLGPLGCATCQAPAERISDGEYSLTGIFTGGKLNQEVLVCGDCPREMMRLLSAHTRKLWEGFLNDNFPSPPSDVIAPEPTVLGYL